MSNFEICIYDLERRGDLDGAIDVARKAVRNQPMNLSYRIKEIELKILTKKYDSAITNLEYLLERSSLLGIDPASVESLLSEVKALKLKTGSGFIFVNTIPKSGTHLLMKVFELAGCKQKTNSMVNSHVADVWPFVDKNEIIDESGGFVGDKIFLGGSWAGAIERDRMEALMDKCFATQEQFEFMGGHLFYHPSTSAKLAELGLRMFVVFRDPRAVANSHAKWVMATHGHNLKRYYKALTPAERVITSVEGISPEFGPKGQAGLLPLVRKYHNMVQWLKEPFVRGVWFDDFLPSNPKRDQAIADSLSWVGLPSDRGSVEKIGQNLFGGTATFRAGKKNSWMEFSEVFETPDIDRQIKEIQSILRDTNLGEAQEIV